jgi:hypothetical protein
MRVLGIVALCAALGGCASQANAPPADPEVWGRVDCVRTQDNPMAEQQFEQAKAICTNRAQAAGIQTSAGMPSGGRNLGDAIGNGIVAGITASQVNTATGNSCMAENGYIRRPQSHHEAACAAVYAQREQMIAAERAATAPPKRKPRPAEPSVPKPGT